MKDCGMEKKGGEGDITFLRILTFQNDKHNQEKCSVNYIINYKIRINEQKFEHH